MIDREQLLAVGRRFEERQMKLEGVICVSADEIADAVLALHDPELEQVELEAQLARKDMREHERLREAAEKAQRALRDNAIVWLTVAPILERAGKKADAALTALHAALKEES